MRRRMNLPEATTWDEIVTNHSDSTIYHLHRWGTLLENVHGHELVYLQEADGVFPLAHVKSRIFGNRLISMPFADYGGPCAQDEKTADRLVSHCEEAAHELGVDFVEIRSPSSRYDQVLRTHGFEKRTDYSTFVLRIDRPLDQLCDAIGRRNRKMVSKAQRDGVQVVEVSDREGLLSFFRLYQITMKRIGSPPQPWSYFRTIWDLFYESNNLLVLLAKYDGKTIAGGLRYLFNGVIQQAYSCSLREYSRLRASDLLQWYLIAWANEHGFLQVDSGRTRANEGTLEFKRRWGGPMIVMPYYYKFCKRELRQRQETQYQWASRLWARCLPEFLANRIGPFIIKQAG